MIVDISFGSHVKYLLEFGDGRVVNGSVSDTVVVNKQLSFTHAYTLQVIKILLDTHLISHCECIGESNLN